MTDIVERLRTEGVANPLLTAEAADEIERLRAALTEIAEFEGLTLDAFCLLSNIPQGAIDD